MKNKGFTLIELLAVIVILAIISLIAIPVLLNVIEKARQGAAKDSAYSYMEAVEIYESQAIIKNQKELMPNVKYNCTKPTIDGDSALAVNDYVSVKGYKPTGSKDYIKLNKKRIVIEGQLTINGYLIIIKDGDIISVEKGEYVDIESLGLNFTNQTMEKGSTIKLVPIFTPNNASDQRVTYKSNNESIVTVDENGLVTAVGNGTTKVVVTSKDNESKKAECNITVITSATGLSLDKTNETIDAGSTVQLTGTITPGDVTTNALTWTSSDNSIAVVDTNGLVTGLTPGTVTISAKTHNEIEATATITVNAVATGITISPTSVLIDISSSTKTSQLTATVTPSNAVDKTVTWTSSNTSVATVSNTGLVTGKDVGTATITAKTNNGKTATSTITVINVTGVTVSPTSASISVGGTKTITATVAPSNASNKTVTWTSSNTSVATVSSSGVVTAKAVGTATITATTYNGKTATSTITTIGPTKVAAKSGETHKGIVYLDPKNLNKYCTASNSVSTPGTKTGCMKWYIFSDSGSNYTMILDHNTTAKVSYETSGTYKEYAQASIKTQVNSDTTGWTSGLNPRLITANEIASITGNTTFDGSSSKYFFFGSNNTTSYAKQTEAQKARQRSFAWLFDYTYNCTNYGCNTADSSTNGYWTSSFASVSSAPAGSSSRNAWYVDGNSGYLYYCYVVYDSYYGVRPVITISKSKISS